MAKINKNLLTKKLFKKVIDIFVKNKVFQFYAIILLVIVLLGNNLRTYNYDSVPHPSETADEYSYGWLGISLLRDKYPTSWSSLSPYQNREFKKINVDSIYDGEPTRVAFPIVSPWFDHPPFFGLITGGYAYLKGVRNFSDAGVGILRRPMLKIAIITTVLIFLLGSKLFGYTTGVISAFFYSIVPTFVISSRLALMENGYIPLFLAALIFAILHFENNKKHYWILANLMGFLGLLFKMSAVSIPLSLIILAVMSKQKNKPFLIIVSVLSIIAGLAVFAGYGLLIDWGMFVKIFQANSSRFYGASSEIFLQAVNGFRITTNRHLTDGWLLAAWISFFSLSLFPYKKEGTKYLTVAIFSYLSVFILFGSESYGWYKYPFFPFLAIALAETFKNLFFNPNIPVFVGLSLLPFGSSVHRLIGVENFQKFVPPLRFFILITLAIYIFSTSGSKGKYLFLYRLFFIFTMALLTWLSIKEIYFYTRDAWFFVT